MEGGTLSQSNFQKDFGDEVVLFCHITTRIPGKENDGMLRDVGGRGFPTFAFLDAEGKVQTLHQGPRTIEGFANTGKAVSKLAELAPKAKAGDPDATLGLLFAKADLGQLKLDEAKELYAKAKPKGDDKAKALKYIAGLEYLAKKEELEKAVFDGSDARSFAREHGRDAAMKANRELQAKVAEAVSEFLANGKEPLGPAARTFWWDAMMAAVAAGDTKAFDRAEKELLAIDKGMAQYIKRVRQQLKGAKK